MTRRTVKWNANCYIRVDDAAKKWWIHKHDQYVVYIVYCAFALAKLKLSSEWKNTIC